MINLFKYNFGDVKAVKLDNEVIIVKRSVSTIILCKKNEENLLIFVKKSVFNFLSKNDILFTSTFSFFHCYESLKACILAPGGLGGCLNAVLSSCVNQLSNICSINWICGRQKKLWFVECSSFGILRQNCGATFLVQTHPVGWVIP